MAEIANNSIDIQVVDTGGENAQYFWHNTTETNGEGAGAHITEMPQDDFISDPTTGGVNTLIDSGGMSIRDGTKERARFRTDEISLLTPDDVNAFKVESSTETSSQSVTKYIFNDYSAVTLAAIGDTESVTYTDIDNVASGEGFSMTFRQSQNTYSHPTVYMVKGTPSTKTITLRDRFSNRLSVEVTYTPPNVITFELLSITGTPEDYTVVAEYIDYTVTTYTPQTTMRGNVVFTDPTKVFVVEDYYTNYSNISSGGNMNWSETKTKTGYYPIGVVGFNAKRATLVVDRAYISDVTVGSCTINMHARAVGSASANDAHLYVLWVKAV